MRFYFAYGSNLWDAQMAARCPQARKLGRASLPGYRWIISARGYANVLESPRDTVEGVLFELSASDEASLDRHEGVAAGWYAKADLAVQHGDRDVVALVYVDHITAEGTPKGEYIHRINAGLSDAKLPEDYVARHVRRFIPG